MTCSIEMAISGMINMTSFVIIDLDFQELLLLLQQLEMLQYWHF
jgi:hypothetical protein